MGDHSRDYQEGRADRRDGETQRRRDELAEHQRNPYAHGELIGRLQQEYVTVRERFENRLSALERFKAQATVIGAIALVILGAVVGVLTTRVLAH